MLENLRIGFYNHIDEGKAQPEMVRRKFEREKFNEMHKKTKVLFDVQPFYFSWSIFDRNYKEYIALKNQIQKLSSHHLICLGGSGPYYHLSDVSRATINLLATASTFLVVAERLIKQYFGEGSEPDLGWNEFRRSVYESSIDYKICYELRNFSQHYQIPLSGLNMGFYGGCTAGSDPYLMIDELLACGYKWKKVQPVLESMEKQVCLSNLLLGYYDCLQSIFLKGHFLFKSEIELSRDCIDGFIKDYKLPPNITPVVFELTHSELDYSKLPQEYMPVGLHKFIDDIVSGGC